MTTKVTTKLAAENYSLSNPLMVNHTLRQNSSSELRVRTANVTEIIIPTGLNATTSNVLLS